MAEGCDRPCFGKKWTLCRPCAVTHVRGESAYETPCEQYDPEPAAHVIGFTCAECGLPSADHPGTGVRRDGLVVIAA